MTYLLVGVDPTQVVTILVILLVDSEVITLDLEFGAQSLPALLGTFDHSTQCPI